MEHHTFQGGCKEADVISCPTQWKGLPRLELAAVRRAAPKCDDGKYEVSSNHSEGKHRSREDVLRSMELDQHGKDAGTPAWAAGQTASASGAAAVHHWHRGVIRQRTTGPGRPHNLGHTVRKRSQLRGIELEPCRRVDRVDAPAATALLEEIEEAAGANGDARTPSTSPRCEIVILVWTMARSPARSTGLCRGSVAC